MKPSIRSLAAFLIALSLACSSSSYVLAEEASSSSEADPSATETKLSSASDGSTDASTASVDEEETTEQQTVDGGSPETGEPLQETDGDADPDAAALTAEEGSSAADATASSSDAAADTDGDPASDSDSIFPEEELQATSTPIEEASSSASSTPPTASTTGSSGPAASSEETAIESGNAVALANILNLVNSNFVNSSGVVLFSNFFNTVLGAIDLREYFASMLGDCSLTSCSGENVVVNTSDNADIDNDVTLGASSGGNVIDTAGNASITTGNAYAGLNLVNVANTNLIDSQYLLVTLNAFQDVDGDIVFPSLSQFFGSLAHGASTPAAIDIADSAAVNNDVSLSASAGGNSTTGTQSSSITTGNAAAYGNVFNELNSSLVGGQSVSIVFRVQGSWAGEIFGAPEGLAWTVGDDGSIYLFDTAGATGDGRITMHGTSTARINNKINVVALTGENAITNADTAVISTGNAYAGANIINVANANVIGRNWILAVINIFGDFHGNIAFGRPDLWVGGQIEVPKRIENGSALTYHYTIINNGDSPASDAYFENTINGDYLALANASLPYESDGATLRFDLGTIPPGGAKEITYTAQIKNTEEGTQIVSSGAVSQHETDNNAADNTEVLAITTDRHHAGNGVRIELGGAQAHPTARELASAEASSNVRVPLMLQRTTQTATISTAAPEVKQEIVVQNTTDHAAHAVTLHDILRDPSGTVIRDETWDLGDVQPGEEIDLSYIITFNPGAPLGTYTLESTALGSDVDSVSGQNGTVVLEEVKTLLPPLLSALGLASSDGDGDGSPVSIRREERASSTGPFVTKETPFFSAPLAEAAGDRQIAAASAAGVPLDPLMIFFGLAAFACVFFTLRLLRSA